MRDHFALPGPKHYEHQECIDCGDLGVIRVKEKDRSFETLMLCNCEEGRRQSYQLPRWEWKHGQIFDRSKCPLEWFKPDKSIVAMKPEFKLAGIESKIQYWRAKIQIAEGFWAQAKQEHENSQGQEG